MPKKITQDQVAKSVEFTLSSRVAERFSNKRVTSATQLLAAASIEEIRDRAKAGLDVRGNPFKRYTRGYERQKARYISGAPVKSKGRKGKRSAGGSKAKLEEKGEYAAEQVYDYMRLSGKSFRDLTAFKVRGFNDEEFIGGAYKLDFKTARSRKIAAYLYNKGYDYFGLSPANTARGQAFIRKMKAILKGNLGIEKGGNLSVFRG